MCWLAFDDAARERGTVRNFAGDARAEEHERAAAMHVRAGARRSRVTRGLQRSVLSPYAPGIAPGDCDSSGQRKATRRSRRHSRARICISTSRTHAGLVVLAVSADSPLGIDVENVRARTHRCRGAIAISQPRRRALAALPRGRTAARFFALWTLKESWIKATGPASPAGLGKCHFGSATSRHGGELVERRGALGLPAVASTEEHVLALALRSAAWHARTVAMRTGIFDQPPTPVLLSALRSGTARRVPATSRSRCSR